MRIFGIQLWSPPLSDVEYVERVRKGIKFHRRMRVFHALFALGMLIAAVFTCELFVRILAHSGTSSGPLSLVNLTFVLAALFGLTIGLMLAKAVDALASVLFELRKDKLLVESWDAMNELLAKSNKLTHEQIESTRDDDGDK